MSVAFERRRLKRPRAPRSQPVDRTAQLQPPVIREVTVVVEVAPVNDPELLRWLDGWITKLLNETGAAGQGR